MTILLTLFCLKNGFEKLILPQQVFVYLDKVILTLLILGFMIGKFSVEQYLARLDNLHCITLCLDYRAAFGGREIDLIIFWQGFQVITWIIQMF